MYIKTLKQTQFLATGYYQNIIQACYEAYDEKHGHLVLCGANARAIARLRKSRNLFF